MKKAHKPEILFVPPCLVCLISVSMSLSHTQREYQELTSSVMSKKKKKKVIHNTNHQDRHMIWETEQVNTPGNLYIS